VPKDAVLLVDPTDPVMPARKLTTYGQDANRILEEVLGTPARPAEIQASLDELFAALTDHRLDDARGRLDALQVELGADDPDLVRARAHLRRVTVLGR
jgi:hypothetical protein